MSTSTKSFTPGLKLSKATNMIKNVVTFELRDYTEEGIFTVTESFDVEPLEKLNAKALLHGYSQKVGDANASVKGAKAKYDASRNEYDRMILEDSWNKISRSTKVKDPKWVEFFIAAKSGTLTEVDARAEAYVIGQEKIEAAMKTIQF